MKICKWRKSWVSHPPKSFQPELRQTIREWKLIESMSRISVFCSCPVPWKIPQAKLLSTIVIANSQTFFTLQQKNFHFLLLKTITEIDIFLCIECLCFLRRERKVPSGFVRKFRPIIRAEIWRCMNARRVIWGVVG